MVSEQLRRPRKMVSSDSRSKPAKAKQRAQTVRRPGLTGTSPRYRPAPRAFLDSANAYSGHWSAAVLAARWPERGGRDLEHQGECVDRRRDRLAEPKKKSLVLPRRFPECICWEAIGLFIRPKCLSLLGVG
jgi:hypothetical protein